MGCVCGGEASLLSDVTGKSDRGKSSFFFVFFPLVTVLWRWKVGMAGWALLIMMLMTLFVNDNK